MDLVTILPAYEDLGFPRVPSPRRYTLGTMRHQTQEERCGQFPIFYSSDPNSDSDHYDPTRECFNIQDGAVVSDDDTIDGDAAAPATAMGSDRVTTEQEEQPPNQVDPCLSQGN